MHRLIRLFATAYRYYDLKRQWRAVEPAIHRLCETSNRHVAALVYGESLRVARAEVPQFHRSEGEEGYRLWGNGVSIAFERALSPDLALSLKGISAWLSLVSAETKGARHRGLQALHGQVAPAAESYRRLHERVLAIRNAA